MKGNIYFKQNVVCNKHLQHIFILGVKRP